MVQQMIAERPAILAYLACRRVPPDQCEDCFQTAVVHVLQGDYQPEPGQQPGHFFRNVAWRVWDRTRKHRERHPMHVLSDGQVIQTREDNPAEAVIAWEEWHHRQRELAGLPEQIRRAFEMSVLQGQKPQQVAQALGISLQAYYRRVHKKIQAVTQQIIQGKPITLRPGPSDSD